MLLKSRIRLELLGLYELMVEVKLVYYLAISRLSYSLISVYIKLRVGSSFMAESVGRRAHM